VTAACPKKRQLRAEVSPTLNFVKCLRVLINVSLRYPKHEIVLTGGKGR
jgi:hypothetical protein